MALLQPRKQREHAVARPACACAVAVALCRNHQVLIDAQIAEHAPALRPETDALARNRIGRKSGNVFALELDGTAPRLEEAHYGGYAGRLPRAVAPEQPQQATRPQRERDVMEDMGVPDERIDSANRKRLTRQDRPPACADRRPPRRACLRQ